MRTLALFGRVVFNIHDRKVSGCKATTALIEKIEGSETRIALKLELPPGAELPLLASIDFCGLPGRLD